MKKYGLQNHLQARTYKSGLHKQFHSSEFLDYYNNSPFYACYYTITQLQNQRDTPFEKKKKCLKKFIKSFLYMEIVHV